MITYLEAIEYEIHSSRWAGEIGWKWMQNLVARYFGRKIGRKYARYARSQRIKARLKIEDALANATAMNASEAQ